MTIITITPDGPQDTLKVRCEKCELSTWLTQELAGRWLLHHIEQDHHSEAVTVQLGTLELTPSERISEHRGT